MTKENQRWILCGVGVCIVIMLLYSLIQYLSGLYPFGTRSNLLWDQDVQYVDYFSFYRNVLLGNAEIGYSFSKSLGGSLMALFGYYLGNPLNALVVFFDTDQLPLFLFLLTMLKMGLSGVTMLIFLRKRFPRLGMPEAAGISTGYGLMQYTMLQCSNIMWLDGVILLPLLLLSVYYFTEYRKKVFLFLMVTASIAVNWYTGYMTCLFAACYFLYERILLMDKCSREELFHLFTDGVRCAAVMVLGVGGSAFIFYPVFKGLQKGKTAWDPTVFYPDFYDSFVDVFRGFSEGNIAGTVSLYCGTIFFAFFIFYFLSRKVQKKEKILSLVSVLFMFVSCWFVPLDCVWSGMRLAASFRFRYSFVVVFLVLYLAARGILCWEEEQDRKKAGLVFLGITAVFLLSHFWKNYETRSFQATLCTLVAYLVIYFLVRNRRIRIPLLGLILAAELTANGVITFDYNYQWNREVSEYQEYASLAEQQADLVQEYDDSVFYRMETVSKRYNEESRCSAYLNDSMAYGYHGIAHYSSTFDQGISDMICDLGYSTLRDLSIYTQPILPSDSLLGIKYVLSREDITGLKKVEELGTVNEKNVYRNPWALDLGMGAADTVSDEIESEDPFVYQNLLFSGILGEEVELFKPVEAVPVTENNTLSFTFPAMDPEDQLYGYIDTWYQDLVLNVDGVYRCNYSCWLSYKVFDIGMADAEHRIDFQNFGGTAEDVRTYFYYLDQDVFEDVIRRLQNDSFDTEVFEDGYVAGTYTAEADGNLLLTVPYDEGWTVTVNGDETEYSRGAGALTVIPVQAGENKIVLKYTVPGRAAGFGITAVSIVIMAVWYWAKKKGKKK